MGQKVNPIGMRIGINKTWDSRWYAEKAVYSRWLHEDFKMRDFIRKEHAEAGISKVELERAEKKIKINIYAARPGLIIGKRGSGVESLRTSILGLTKEEVYITIQEVHKTERDAQLIAESIAMQIERRVAYRRAMKKALMTAIKLGALGVKIRVGGRLAGSEMARSEWHREGRVPLQTFKANIDYGTSTAKTTYGTTGIKVWVYLGNATEIVRKEAVAA